MKGDKVETSGEGQGQKVKRKKASVKKSKKEKSRKTNISVPRGVGTDPYSGPTTVGSRSDRKSRERKTARLSPNHFIGLYCLFEPLVGKHFQSEKESETKSKAKVVNFKIDTCPSRLSASSRCSTSTRVGNEIDLFDFTSHRFESLGAGRRRDWYRERVLHSKPDYFDLWMQKETFYDIDFGIHSMKIPKTGEYQFTLSGWGTELSKGCKITMIKRMYQGYCLIILSHRL